MQRTDVPSPILSTPRRKSGSGVEALTFQVRVASAYSVLVSQAIAARVGIHSSDMETLDLLLTHGPMTAGKLAELTGLTTGAITRLVDRLLAEDLVSRQEDPHDRRRVIIAANEAECDARAGRYYAGLAEAAEKAWSEFTPEELDAAVRVLQRSNELVLTFLHQLKTQP
ncbi:MAG: winged helix-turn-helix transcriptional regulator [Dehalococcoidia bacterium]|nr:winged helix-turn-helix transcriptional regulator [Dehalococcoidia bacterium]